MPLLSMDEARAYIKADAEYNDWKVKARADRKVDAIRAFRDRTGAGLREAKDVVEEYMERVRHGEVFNGTGDNVTHVVTLPNGGMLHVIYGASGVAKLQYVSTEAERVAPHNLPQAIADAVLKYS